MLSSVFGNKNKYYGTRTFTYYLPSPPSRKSGYQEREFDNLIHDIAKLGFDILDIKTSAHACENKSGVWIVCLLGAKSKTSFEMSINIKASDQSELSSHHVPLDPDIIHD